MKKTKLRADPAKTRAWADRSAAAAAAKAATRPRAPLKRSKALSARQGPRSKPDRGRAPVKFRGPSPARKEKCATCGRRAAHWHHLLPQQAIRAYVRSLRLRDVKEERRLTSKLLGDRRNLWPQCPGCHAQHELHAEALTRDDVPASAFAFADELGPEWGERLRRMYPAAAGGSENGSTRRSSA